MQRADSEKIHMGLTAWDSSRWWNYENRCDCGQNYLQKDELESLGRIVNAYLDLVEGRAKRKIPMTMEDWVKSLVLFLQFDERDIL